MAERERLIPLHGGYRRLKSFQIGQLIYDVAVRFCARYVDRFSRTRDQMVQAARSGVQNIAEDSQTSGTSSAQLVANATLSLLNLCGYLLDRQLAAQEAAFQKQGGFTERFRRP